MLSFFSMLGLNKFPNSALSDPNKAGEQAINSSNINHFQVSSNESQQFDVSRNVSSSSVCLDSNTISSNLSFTNNIEDKNNFTEPSEYFSHLPSSPTQKVSSSPSRNSPMRKQPHHGFTQLDNEFKKMMDKKRKESKTLYEYLYTEKTQRTWFGKIFDFFCCKHSDNEKVHQKTRIASYLNCYLDILPDEQKVKLIKKLYVTLGKINGILADLNQELRQDLALDTLISIMGFEPFYEKTANKNIREIRKCLNEVADLRCNRLRTENICFIKKQIKEQTSARIISNDNNHNSDELVNNNCNINWSEIFVNFYLEIENLHSFYCQGNNAAQVSLPKLIQQNLDHIQVIQKDEKGKKQKVIEKHKSKEGLLPTIESIQQFNEINKELTSILDLSHSKELQFIILDESRLTTEINYLDSELILNLKDKISPIMNQLIEEINQYKGEPSKKSNDVSEVMKFLLGGIPKPRHYLRPKKEYPQLTNDEKITLCKILLAKISDSQNIKKSSITNLDKHNHKAEKKSWPRKFLGFFNSRKQNPKVDEVSYIDWATVFSGFWDARPEPSSSPS